jgi:hypothetical protein
MSKPTPLSRTKDGLAVAFAARADLDARDGARRAELERVGEQVHPHHAQQRRIDVERRQRRDLPLDGAAARDRLELLAHVGDQRIEIRTSDLRRRLPGTREGEQVVDQLAHAQRGGGHAVRVVRRALIETLAAVLQQQRGVAAQVRAAARADRARRCT